MRALLLLVLLAQGLFAQTIGNRTLVFHDYGTKSDANGKIVTYGGALYGTGINLSGDTTTSGDSSVVGYLFAQNDTDNQSSTGYKAHRAYVIDGLWRQVLFDTTATRYVGQKMFCPCYVEFWYMEVNMVLHGHGPGKISDWSSPLTVVADSGNVWPDVVTTAIDTNHYLHLEHTPRFDTTQHIYQVGASNDPTGALKVVNGKWHLMSFYYDPWAYGDSSGYAKAYLDGHLVSHALVRGRAPFISQMHAGLYCAAAVKPLPGKPWPSVYNDRFFAIPVPNEKIMFHRYLTGRRFRYWEMNR